MQHENPTHGHPPSNISLSDTSLRRGEEGKPGMLSSSSSCGISLSHSESFGVISWLAEFRVSWLLWVWIAFGFVATESLPVVTPQNKNNVTKIMDFQITRQKTYKTRETRSEVCKTSVHGDTNRKQWREVGKKMNAQKKSDTATNTTAIRNIKNTQ